MDKKVTITLKEEQIYDIMIMLEVNRMRLMEVKKDTSYVQELYNDIRNQMKNVPASPNLKGERFLAMFF